MGPDNVLSFSCDEVRKAIDSLNTGKAADSNSISVEHIKYADAKIGILLTTIFNAMLRHGLLPSSLIESTITPVVKTKMLI